MIYRFLILSDEVDDFKREIQIRSDATFLDLHRAILDATGFEEGQMCSFFLCDDDWHKKTEITLIDMGAPSEVDTYVMDGTPLDELLEDERQKMLYVFDYMMERVFFMELSEIITGQHLDRAICTVSAGLPPVQTYTMEEMEKRMDPIDLDEDFYGDSEYDPEELGELGYDDAIESYYEDDRY
ncbi:MAG: hypothetical protein LBS42_01790 [Tannerella sp.]|jgi:hypothetical protein|nr:hypothetical protein [Tannerella sp.]